jgi:hypothetical protein
MRGKFTLLCRYRHFSKQVSKIFKFSPDHISVLCGLLLSDGNLSFKQSLAHSGYFLKVFNILSHFCSCIPLFSTGLRNGIKTFALGFQTRALPCFTEQRYLWYPQGKILFLQLFMIY